MKIKTINIRETYDRGDKYAKTTLIIKDFQDELKESGSLYKFYLDHIEQRCSCVYDCCGHWFSGLDGIKRKGKNKLIVHLSWAQNY